MKHSNRRLWILTGILVVSLSACNSKPAAEAPQRVEAAKPEAPAPATAEKPAGANEVVLDAKMQQEARVRSALAVERPVPVLIQANGRLTVNETRTWRIGAVTDGRVMKTMVLPGDSVKKEQVLAGLHSHEIHEARAEYRRAQQESVRLKSALAYAQKQRDRARRLYELKAASLEQLEHAETELKNAQTAVVNNDTEIERTRIHLVEFLQVSPESPKEHKDGDAEHDDDLIPVKSPADGTLLERKVTAGSVVKGGDDLFVVSDLANLWMIAAVSEEHVGKLRLGMRVDVKVQAYPDLVFPGRITRFGEQLDPDTRTLPTRVELVNTGRRLKPEMYGTAEIQTGGGASGIFVPENAIQQVNGQSVVFVERSAGHYEVRAVESGRVLDHFVEVTRGLASGDRIVVEGSYVIKSQLLKGSLSE